MTPPSLRIAVVGCGRLGSALAPALGAGGPYGRGFDGTGHDVVLLCVPDAEIAAAAHAVAPGRLVGHCSGATTLESLAPHEAFSVHPLMTVTRDGATFAGASAAIAGSTDRARATARTLAERAGLRPFELADEDRAAYHAAASIASNFLVALEWAAERLFPGDRAALAPLIRATVDNWEQLGARGALTGPIARGDEATVARQRAAVAERDPSLLDLFDVCAAHTRELATS
jgi:predicted short-subunit dehydrogenase-like oxidoreductase (DUF2520 family)